MCSSVTAQRTHAFILVTLSRRKYGFHSPHRRGSGLRLSCLVRRVRRIPQGLCVCVGGGWTNTSEPSSARANTGASSAQRRWLSGLQQGDSGTQKPGSGEVLTKARGGDGVHINLVIADLLVALSVGCWLGQSGTLTAMASSHLVHALYHTGLEPLPASG